MNRDMSTFVIGIAAGVGLGMLLAPRSGAKTRSLIQGKANDGAAYLRQRGSDIRDAATEAIRDGRNKVAKGADAVKAAVEAGKQAYSQSNQS